MKRAQRQDAADPTAFEVYLNAMRREEAEGRLAADICPHHSARDAGFVVNRSGKGPPLVYCPGADGDDLPFFPLRRLLEKRFTMYSFRYRMQPPHTAAQYAADVIEACEALGLEDFHLLGESLGSIPALSMAVDRPSNVRGLILVGGFTKRVSVELIPLGKLAFSCIPVPMIRSCARWILPRGFLRKCRDESRSAPHIYEAISATLNREFLRVLKARLQMVVE